MEEKQEKPKKKKKAGKYILLVILLLIAGLIVAAVIHFLPIWSSARDFEQKLNLGRFSYVMDLEFEESKLSDKQRALFGSFAEMNGLEQKDIMRLHIEGSVWDDRVYAELTPAGAGEPAVEFYLSKAADLINAGPIYNKIRSGLVEEYALLDALLPAPVGDVYMTLEQAEQLSGQDLSTLRDFEPTFSQYRFSALEYFAVMAALPLVKGTEKNSLILEEVKKKDSVYLHFEAENPAQIAAETLEAYKQFSTPELAAMVETVRALKSIEIMITSEGVQEIKVPTNVMDSKLPGIVENIRQLIEQLKNLTPELQQTAVDAYIRQQGMDLSN